MSTPIENNTTELEKLLAKANALPDAAAVDAVLYTPQELTDEQKAQARANIGAADAETVEKALTLTVKKEVVVTSDNLYNRDAVESGGYYIYTSGAWTERSDMCSTGFIACRAGDTFYNYNSTASVSYGGNVTFYDEGYNFVVGLNVTSSPYIVPSNEDIRYFKTSFPSFVYTVKPLFQINKDEVKHYDVYNEEVRDSTGYHSEYPIYAPNIPSNEQETNNVNTLYYSQSYNNDVAILHKRSVEFGTTYWIFVVNRTKFDGTTIKPKLVGTDATNPLGGTATTNVTSFALNGDYLHVVNGGIFLSSPNEADGITIIDGTILKSAGVEQFTTEQYVLGIDASGNFKTYRNETAENILADGSIYAVTGFVPLIEGGEAVDNSVLSVCPHYSIKHPRQIIGRLKNGNYFTFACDGRTDGEAGMTLEECIKTIMEDLPVDFAFNLDGGGSTQSVVGKKLVNRILDNRVVPNVIVFQ